MTNPTTYFKDFMDSLNGVINFNIKTLPIALLLIIVFYVIYKIVNKIFKKYSKNLPVDKTVSKAVNKILFDNNANTDIDFSSVKGVMKKDYSLEEYYKSIGRSDLLELL